MIEAAAIGLGALNVVWCICRHAPMSAATHQWGPRWLFAALGIAAAGLCWAAVEVSADWAMVGQLVVTAVLLHKARDGIGWQAAPAWRDTVQQVRGGD